MRTTWTFTSIRDINIIGKHEKSERMRIEENNEAQAQLERISTVTRG